MKTYFITGATGAIGSSLVPLLLQDRNSQVRLLIRAKDDEHLCTRLAELVKFWGIEKDQGDIRRRITAVRGDAVLPYFGIEEDTYRALTDECTHIVHSAGNVRMNLSLEEARRSALDSAGAIVNFARDCQRHGHFEKIEFVSTVGVGGRRRESLPETWITEKRLFHNTYEEAKAEAEQFILGQIEAGLPITIHRPSMVVGDSRTGRIIHFQIFYHLCEFLSGRRTMSVVPAIHQTFLDIVPLDYVASAIWWSSTQTSTRGRILHLCSGREGAVEITALRQQIRNIYRAAGEEIPKSMVVPLRVFTCALPVIRWFVSPATKRSMTVLPFLFDYLGEDQTFENKNTRALLEENGIPLPSADAYLEKVLWYYLEKRTTPH